MIFILFYIKYSSIKMKNYKTLCNNKKEFLIQYLGKLLDYQNINYHKSELLSYSNSELNILINRYSIKYKNITKRYNKWYYTNI